MKKMTMRRLPRLAASIALGLTTAACTAIYSNNGPPTVIYHNPFGPSQVYPGGPPQPAGGTLAAPPGNLESNGPASPMRRGRDGVYSGTAVPLNTAGGLCIRSQKIRDFRVQGDRVRWGRFRGRVEDNGLQMVNGNTWVTGQFDGGRFSGQISIQDRFGNPGCTFMMTLHNTSP